MRFERISGVAKAGIVSLAMMLGLTSCSLDYVVGYVYVTAAKSTPGIIHQYSIDYQSGALTEIGSPVKTGANPVRLVAAPNGKFVYVTSEQDNQVAAIDLKKMTVAARIPTGPRPRAIAFTPDSAWGFATSENGAQLTIIDAKRNRAAGTIKIEPVAKTPLGPRPMGAAFAPDGKQLYVSTGRGSSPLPSRSPG